MASTYQKKTNKQTNKGTDYLPQSGNKIQPSVVTKNHIIAALPWWEFKKTKVSLLKDGEAETKLVQIF